MSQLTIRSDAHLHRTGETFRHTVTRCIHALWRAACRHAERPDRFVPYC